MLSVVMLSVVMLNVVMLGVVMLNVYMLIVVAPFQLCLMFVGKAGAYPSEAPFR
jgi:hypothetical protein